MKKTNKKGFTIVELVIVIAVVAILAAVLIPTFVSVVNKANVSNDTALVKNINITLAAEEITDGKPATMHDALPPRIILYLVILRGKTKALPPLFLSLLSPWGEDKNVAPPAPFLAFPLGGRGTASAVDEGNFIFYSVRKGKLFSESVFPFSRSFLFRKLLITLTRLFRAVYFKAPYSLRGNGAK